MPAKRTKKPALQADAAYENAQMVARDLLQRLGELLDDMPRPNDKTDPVHWGHVGSVGHINELLGQAVSFLTGEDGE